MAELVEQLQEADGAVIGQHWSGYHRDGRTCQAGTGGWLCTRRANHNGPHIATGPDGFVYQIWRVVPIIDPRLAVSEGL